MTCAPMYGPLLNIRSFSQSRFVDREHPEVGPGAFIPNHVIHHVVVLIVRCVREVIPSVKLQSCKSTIICCHRVSRPRYERLDMSTSFLTRIACDVQTAFLDVFFHNQVLKRKLRRPPWRAAEILQVVSLCRGLDPSTGLGDADEASQSEVLSHYSLNAR